MAVKRLNYHTGLFLEEAEFQLEQNYHLLMRRRLNYSLFTPGVLYGLSMDYTGGYLTINPGIAIDEHVVSGEKFGREIIVLPPDHDATEILSGLSEDIANVWITISYDEKEDRTDIKPPTDRPSRTTEFFKIEALTSNPGEGTERILIGQINLKSAKHQHVEPSQKANLRLGGAVSLVSISITPANPNVQAGNTISLKATGTRSDNSNIDLTNTASWSSSNINIATVSEKGIVKGIIEGTAEIRAEADGITGAVNVTVSHSVTLVSIEISSVSSTVKQGEKLQLTATGTFSNDTTHTQDLTNNVTWSSDNNDIAEVNASGEVLGKAGGNANITAKYQGQSDTIQVKVSPIVLAPVFRDISLGDQFYPRSGLVNNQIIIFCSNFFEGEPSYREILFGDVHLAPDKMALIQQTSEGIANVTVPGGISGRVHITLINEGGEDISDQDFRVV